VTNKTFIIFAVFQNQFCIDTKATMSK